MSALKYVPLVIVLSLFVIHNFLFPDSIVASEIIYLGYVLTAVVGCAVTLVGSWVHGNKLTGKYTTSRFWASNVLSGALLLFVGYYGLLLALDIGRQRVIERVVSVHANLDNLTGSFVLQQPTFLDEKKNKVTLMFLFRLRYLRSGEKYRIQYAERSGFILAAQISAESARQP